MVKSDGDPDTSEVLLPSSTKWIQSLQLPAHPPKSYSDRGQGKWEHTSSLWEVWIQVEYKNSLESHSISSDDVGSGTPAFQLGSLRAGRESHPFLSQAIEAPFQKVQRRRNPYEFMFRKQPLSWWAQDRRSVCHMPDRNLATEKKGSLFLTVNSGRYRLLSLPAYSWGYWGTERLNMSKVNKGCEYSSQTPKPTLVITTI